MKSSQLYKMRWDQTNFNWFDISQRSGASTGLTISEVEKQKLGHKSTPLIAKIFYKNYSFCLGKTILWNNGTVKETPQPQVCGSIKPVNSKDHWSREIFSVFSTKLPFWQISHRILKKFNQQPSIICPAKRWSTFIS